MIALLNILKLPWERARGFLILDMERIQAALVSINARIDRIFSDESSASTEIVPVSHGGTGESSFTAGDILAASAATTIFGLPDIATGNALLTGGVATLPFYGKVGLTTHVSGILSVANGGTGVAGPFTAGSVVFAGPSGIYAQDNVNFFWDDTNNRLLMPTLVGGSAVGSILNLLATSGNGTLGSAGASVKIFAGNNGAFEIARFFSVSANDYAYLLVGIAPASSSLGSGGNQITVGSNTAGSSGGFQVSTNAVTNGTDTGYLDFGTFGCPAAEKRSGAIHGFLEASAAATVTGSLRFYTSNAGVIAEWMRITPTGLIAFGGGATNSFPAIKRSSANLVARLADDSANTFMLASDFLADAAGSIAWTGRSKLVSSADALITFSNAANTSGFGLQMGTADTMIVANKAQNAYGTVDALAYLFSGVSGFTSTVWTFPTRSKISSSADSLLTLTNNAASSGFGLQMGTADTMIVANQAQNAYGNIGLAKIVTYNSLTTVSNGVPSELATINTTGLTANVGATTLYAVPASGEGMYRVSAYVVETVAGSVSSTLPNVQVVYTDKDSNTSVTLDVTPILGIAGIGQTGALTANTVGTVASGVVVIYVKLSTTIQYLTTNYASTLAGMTYALRIRLEAI